MPLPAPTPPAPAMPWRRTFLLGFGFFGISLVWPLYDSFVPLFLLDFGLSNTQVGVGMTVDNYINLFVQPWVGQRSDRARTRLGRRFPFVMIGAPLAALGAMLIPFAAQRSLPLLLAAMLLFTLSMALFRSPVVALLGDLFPPSLRGKANGVINFMGVLAAVLAFVVGGQLFDQSRPLPFVVAGLAMLGMLALLLAFTREPATPFGAGEASAGLRATVRALRHNPDRRALWLLLALAAWPIGITALQAFWTPFATREMGLSEGAASQLLSFYPLAGLLAAIPGGYVGAALGHRRTIGLCLGVVALLLAAFLAIPPALFAGASSFTLLEPATWGAAQGLPLVIALLLGAGAAMTIVTVNTLPLLFDAAPAGQLGGYAGLYRVRARKPTPSGVG